MLYKTIKSVDVSPVAVSAQDENRLNAVGAILRGKRQVEVANVCGVTRQAVSRWLRAYREAGEKGLITRQRGRPKGSSFPACQAVHIATTVLEHSPEELNLPFYLWEREAVARLIEQRYGVRFSVWTVGRYLREWGFTLKKPLSQAFEKSPEGVRRLVEKEYHLIKRQARHEKAHIYWGSVTAIGYTYLNSGSHRPFGDAMVTPERETRAPYDMIAAITNKGQVNVLMYERGIKQRASMDFLGRLVRLNGHKKYFVIEDHPVYHSREIDSWAKRNTEQLRMFFLPGSRDQIRVDRDTRSRVNESIFGRYRNERKQGLVTNIGF